MTTPIYPPPYHPADSSTITLQEVLDAWDVVDRLDAELVIAVLLYAHGGDLDDVHSALMDLYRARGQEVPWWSQRVAESQRDLDAAHAECANLRDELAAVRAAKAESTCKPALQVAPAIPIPIPEHFTAEDREVWRRLCELHGAPAHDEGVYYPNATWSRVGTRPVRADLSQHALDRWYLPVVGWCHATYALPRIG